MSLSIGIVGLPNVGKSTIFNTITGNCVPAENFPFCTIDPSIGIVAVPDKRLEKLKEISNSKKTINAIVKFIDIAGLVKGASKGDGLGNTFLSNIREVDIIAHMVRGFDKKDIIHVEGDINPVRDIEIINTELLISDLQIVEKRIVKIKSDIKKNIKEALIEDKILEKTLDLLQKGRSLLKELNKEELKALKPLGLITSKKMFFIYNVDLESPKDKEDEFIKYINKNDYDYIKAFVKLESELATLTEKEQSEMKKLMGVEEYSGIELMIKKAYEELDLVTYFTTGEVESRAWSIKKNSLAPEAAGAIHTDFTNKFIKAEVVAYEDLIKSGSISSAREKGLYRTEGKTYIVKDGDVIYFRI